MGQSLVCTTVLGVFMPWLECICVFRCSEDVDGTYSHGIWSWGLDG